MNRSLLLLLALLFALGGCANTPSDDDPSGATGDQANLDGDPDNAGDSDGEADGEQISREVQRDIDYPDTLIAVYDKQTGMIKMVLADHDNQRYIRIREAGDTPWPYADPRKLALTNIPGALSQTITSNYLMREIHQDMREWGYFDHAYEITGTSLAGPQSGAAIILAHGNRLWRMDVPSRTPSKKYLDAYIKCKIELVKWSAKIPSYQVSNVNAGRAFSR